MVRDGCEWFGRRRRAAQEVGHQRADPDDGQRGAEPQRAAQPEGLMASPPPEEPTMTPRVMKEECTVFTKGRALPVR